MAGLLLSGTNAGLCEGIQCTSHYEASCGLATQYDGSCSLGLSAGVSLCAYRCHFSTNRLCIVLCSSITRSVNTGQLILLFATSDQHAEGRQRKFKCTAEGDRIVKAAFSSHRDRVKQTSKCY